MKVSHTATFVQPLTIYDWFGSVVKKHVGFFSKHSDSIVCYDDGQRCFPLNSPH